MKKALMLAVLTILMLISFGNHPGFAQSYEKTVRDSQTLPEFKEEVVDVNWDWYKGDKFAKLVIIEFCDYESSFCAKHVRETLPEIEKEFISIGKVRYLLLEFPSNSHKQAFKTAEAANCAIDENKVWEMRGRLYANQNALEPENLYKAC